MKKLDDSAQLLLIAGFAVGIGIVVLTVMLNNVIYASNIASESSIDTSRYDIANAIQITTEAHEDAYQYAIKGGSFDNDSFVEYLGNYTDKASSNYGISGLTFSCRNSNLSKAYFTQSGLADGKDDWTLVENIKITNLFALSIPDTSELGNESNRVTIQAINISGNTLWSMEFYNSSGKINITISDQSSIIGNYQSNTGEINITSDLIDGSGIIPGFRFSDRTAGKEYSINIINGSHAIGTYFLSGNLSTDQPFTQARYWVVNPTITMSSREMVINRTIPISLPGGVQ
ncbi:hypothetical protein V7O62_08020 [Methanolobus sp. ZRKC2]|uniref:hypothetical protein n=1 Tax=Methanolobus sp. ZRKC2 TaxID=3125783 RepID=UPI003251D627